MIPGFDDPLPLAQALIRCPSVTPQDAGALDLYQRWLEALGFRCHRLPFGEPPIENLYARIGNGGRHFCYAGHSDVVPPGPLAGWSEDPFAAVVRDGQLIGRGAADMKGSLAAFAVAAARALRAGKMQGSLSLLITGDEEGVAEHGTRRILDWMREHGEQPEGCLVGEPTSAQQLGDMAKIGRRGSLNASITVLGAQGHVAYPDRADNPVTRLVHFLDAAKSRKLDDGNAHFQPSNLEITQIRVDNDADNVIPAQAHARLNIRFNTSHSGASLSDWLRSLLVRHAPAHDIAIRVSGEAFISEPGPLAQALVQAVAHHCGQMPELSTTGGTSDARFIHKLCPVIEFGLVGQSMHKADEHVAVKDLSTLAAIYESMIESQTR